MTALSRTPENTNILQPTKFLLTFDRIGSTTYFCQSVNLPGVSLGQAPINTPMLDYFAPGNKLIYNQLNVDFLVDEKLDTWRQLYSWFQSIASPESFDERNRLSDIQNKIKTKNLKSYSDATLTLLSALNNPILRVQFINLFPISLSDIQFDTKMSAEDVVMGTATFVYDYFKFIDID
jgi:hypothetical protein